MKAFRTALGLTQSDLAQLIGVSQSMIARCESQNRALAIQPHLRFMALYTAWLNHQKMPGDSLAKNFRAAVSHQNTETQQMLLQRIKDLEFQIKRCRHELQLQRKHFKQVRALWIMTAIWQQASTAVTSHWLDYLAQRSAMALKNCSPSQQQLLQLQITNAQASLVHTRKVLRKLLT